MFMVLLFSPYYSELHVHVASGIDIQLNTEDLVQQNI